MGSSGPYRPGMSVGFWVAVILAVMHGAAMFAVWLVTRKKKGADAAPLETARITAVERQVPDVASGTVKVVLRLALPSGTEEGVVWEVREGHLGDVAEGREIPVRRASPSGYVAPAVPFAELSEMHTRLWVRGS